MKKIKKYYPLIVGLVLLLSVAAYGTRAYFSDSTSQEAGIKLTLGNVKVNSESEEWMYNPENNAYNDQLVVEESEKVEGVYQNIGKVATVRNVRPGDSFSRKFTITNDGSLDANLVIDKDILDKKDGPFEIEFVVKDEENSLPLAKVEPILLKTTEKKNIEMIISISTDSKHNKEYNLPTDKDTLNLMSDIIEVQLIQADAANNAN